MGKKNPGHATVYLDPDVQKELHEEAKRQDRNISWLIRKAWEIAKGQIKKEKSEDKENT